MVVPNPLTLEESLEKRGKLIELLDEFFIDCLLLQRAVLRKERHPKDFDAVIET
jgi:hypothetical protein